MQNCDSITPDLAQPPTASKRPGGNCGPACYAGDSLMSDLVQPPTASQRLGGNCGPACYAGDSVMPDLAQSPTASKRLGGNCGSACYAGDSITNLSIRHQCDDYDSYRAARVKSLFNAESGCNFNLDVEMDLSGEWNIGVVVGPSGSGKTSIGKKIFGCMADTPDSLRENTEAAQRGGGVTDGEAYRQSRLATEIHDYHKRWPQDKPIIDAIVPKGSFDEVTGALASVGLGDVPAWLRPFHVLSNGEQFRAGLARLICEKPKQVVIDEFTSVIDRRIAQIGSQAFQKAWRRANPTGKAVLLTPHYDILDWVQPDWLLDLRTGKFARGCLRRRPPINVEIFKVNGSYWRFFKQHYYLNLPMPPAAEYYVGLAEGELAFHTCVCPFFTANAYRATRLVVMPEWQGAGIGVRLLEWVCQRYLDGLGRCNKKLSTFFHTSHPQLCAALRRRPCWINTKRSLYGGNKTKSAASLTKSGSTVTSGYGGHFRAVQSFKYIGHEDEEGGGAK